MADERELITVMPAERAKVGQDACEIIGPMVHKVFDDISKMSGEANELRDDALGAVATIAAHVGAQFFALLVLHKNVPWDEAVEEAVTELELRLRVLLAGAEEAAHGEPETIQ